MGHISSSQELYQGTIWRVLFIILKQISYLLTLETHPSMAVDLTLIHHSRGFHACSGLWCCCYPGIHDLWTSLCCYETAVFVLEIMRNGVMC